MKIAMIAAVSTALLAVPIAAIANPDPPGHAKKHGHGHVPPGLAKKPGGMPPGQYKKWARGERLPRSYFTDRDYYVRDPERYRLAPAPAGYRWVMVRDDAYLTNTSNGLIANVILGLVQGR